MMKLTPNQKQAIDKAHLPTAIVAGAGSGKTEVLTQRVIRLLKSGKTELGQIAAITFTEKAAQELKSRVAAVLPKEKKQDLPWAMIGTFHGFCLNILKENGPLAGYSDAISIWDEHTARVAIHQHCRAELLDLLEKRVKEAIQLSGEMEFRHLLTLMEELFHFRAHAEKALLLDGAEDISKPEREFIEGVGFLYQKILERYNRGKKKRESLDFQDLEMETLKLLKTDRGILGALQKNFKHILVDEAQDINDLQKELLELLFEPLKNTLCIVGDPKQSIYRFRGANVGCFQDLIDKILKAGGELIELKENFRSRPEILDFINQTFKTIFPPNQALPLVATREASPSLPLEWLGIEVPEKASSEERRKREAQKIARYIKTSVEKKKSRFGDHALLFQSLRDIRHYEEAFQSFQIPYRLFGGRGFLEAQEISDLLFCLKFMVHHSDRMALVGLMRSPFLGLDDITIHELAIKHPKDLWKPLLKLKEAKWLKDLFERREGLSGAEILEQAVAKTHYDLLIDQLDPAGAKLANMEQLIELIREMEMEEGASLEEVLEFFEALKKRGSPMAKASSIDLSIDCCQIMTVHSAKGLQFPILHLPDLIREQPKKNHRFLFARGKGLGFSLREKSNPLSPPVPTARMLSLLESEKFQETEEKKRLLYVALTRAREKIVIPKQEGVRRAGPWHHWVKEALTDNSKWNRHSFDGPEKGEHSFDPNEKAFAKSQPILPHETKKNHYTVTELKQIADGISSRERTPSLSPKRKGLSGANLGDLVHAVLKNVGKLKEISLEELVAKTLFDLELIAAENEIQNVTGMIEQFLASKIAPPSWEGEHEIPFRFKLADIYISGVIDYLMDTERGLVLCDFKTDENPDPEKYRLQTNIYTLALSEIPGKTLLETQLLFLKQGLLFREEVTKKRLKETREKLLALIGKGD